MSCRGKFIARNLATIEPIRLWQFLSDDIKFQAMQYIISTSLLCYVFNDDGFYECECDS